ncbi:hypothetical protein KIPB_011197, partial [Kipferlia bialata]
VHLADPKQRPKLWQWIQKEHVTNGVVSFNYITGVKVVGQKRERETGQGPMRRLSGSARTKGKMLSAITRHHSQLLDTLGADAPMVTSLWADTLTADPELGTDGVVIPPYIERLIGVITGRPPAKRTRGVERGLAEHHAYVPSEPRMLYVRLFPQSMYQEIEARLDRTALAVLEEKGDGRSQLDRSLDQQIQMRLRMPPPGLGDIGDMGDMGMEGHGVGERGIGTEGPGGQRGMKGMEGIEGMDGVMDMDMEGVASLPISESPSLPIGRPTQYPPSTGRGREEGGGRERGGAMEHIPVGPSHESVS